MSRLETTAQGPVSPAHLPHQPRGTRDDARDRERQQAGLTLVLSLAVTAIASAVMVWLTAWHPRALLALAAVGIVSCAARLVCGVRR